MIKNKYFFNRTKWNLPVIPAFSSYDDLDSRNAMPATITIRPPVIRAIFNKKTVKAMSTAQATNKSPSIITPSPIQRFMNPFIS